MEYNCTCIDCKQASATWVCDECQELRDKRFKEKKTDTGLKNGDQVVMHTCMEAKNPKYAGKIWTVSSEHEWELCGSMVVMLEGFSGAFASQYLQKLDFTK
ncbi:hypothetical protein [Brevibacillus reuszeri]|uniref:hypothetical protein n=1 Tax=Brevibacillus reuszeri TaxID=54915 RepID=UPI0028A13BC8|nr:hypothetical protein [Brevibacillus reuszeri]